jgi:hypothetical protein
MYFWRNLLLLSSLSCSSLTASIRLRMVNSESCSCLACLYGVSYVLETRSMADNVVTYLRNSSLASFPKFCRSSLVLLGLIARTSSGSIFRSIGPTSNESLGTTMLPLLFRDGRRGRRGTGACIDIVCWSRDEAEDESDRASEEVSRGRTCSMVIMVSAAIVVKALTNRSSAVELLSCICNPASPSLSTELVLCDHHPAMS